MSEASQNIVRRLDDSMVSPAQREADELNARARAQHEAALAWRASPQTVEMVERQMQRDARERELMLEMGLPEVYLTAGSPAWEPKHAAIRDRAKRQRQDEEDAALPRYAASAHPDDGIDWSIPPRDGLREALKSRDAAIENRDVAAEVLERARRERQRAEDELGAYADLSERIDRHWVATLKAGAPGELPFALARAEDDRVAAERRYEPAKRAEARLAGDLREAEAELSRKQAICHRWCKRILEQHGEALVPVLAERWGAYVEVLAEAEALTFYRVPSAGQIDSHIITGAVRAAPKIADLSLNRPARLAALQEIVGRLLDDPDAEIDLS